MMLEQLIQLKQDLIDGSKVEKPSLDDKQIDEMDILVSEALEFNKELKFKLFNKGFVENVTGRVHYINFEQQKLAFYVFLIPVRPLLRTVRLTERNHHECRCAVYSAHLPKYVRDQLRLRFGAPYM